jgi:hypothetical protein
MDWDEVIVHLRARYQVGRATLTWVELWRSFREGARAIRQQQTVRCAVYHGQTYYVIEAEIAAPVGARPVLCASAELAIGTLVERGDALVAQAQLPASALTPSTLDRLLLGIGREAMSLSLLVWQHLHAAAEDAPGPARAQQSQPPASTRSAS